MGNFMKRIRETFMNKLLALAFIGLGVWTLVESGDCAFFMMSLFMGIVLLFAKEEWIK